MVDSGPDDTRVPGAPADAGDAGRTDVESSDAATNVAQDARPTSDAALCESGTVEDCGRNIGRCRAGTRVCGPVGRWGECVGGVAPQSDVCNGADDDCNGVVDDEFEVGRPCDGIGACGQGVIECRNEVFTRCSTDPGGSRAQDEDEECNAVDDDCDGEVDEGFAVGAACVGACGTGETECGQDGNPICGTDPGGAAHIVAEEACNGVDDDCDGAVDEGFALGSACRGIGMCGDGAIECDDSGATRCSTEPGGTESGASPEVCNGIDDDCDGALDEDFEVGVACEGEGACRAGETQCAADGRLICDTERGGLRDESRPEICDGEDNDCDGAVDEGLGVGEPCPAFGACAAGLLECGPDGTTVCDSLEAATPEVCNAIDDDCDGVVDEDFGLGAECGGSGACGFGVVECDAEGGTQCSTEPGGRDDQSSPERCDGVDNDCNGTVDDGQGCGGDTCETAPGLVFGDMHGGETSRLSNDYDQSLCLGIVSGPDQVFRIDPLEAGDYVVGIAPLEPDFDPVFWVSPDCGDIGGCIVGAGINPAGRAEARVLSARAGETYYLVVDSRSDVGGAFAASVQGAMAGESCDNAVVLPIPGRFVGTTEFPTRQNDVSGAQCPRGRLTAGVDQAFRIEVPARGTLRATVTPGPLDSDPILYAVTDCDAVDDTCVASSGAAGPSEPESIAVEVEPGTYFIVVDHEGNRGGAFLLEVVLDP